MPLWEVIALNLWFVPMHLVAFAFQDHLLSSGNSRFLWVCRALTIMVVLVIDDGVVNPSSVVSFVLTAIAAPLLFFSGPMRERLAVAAMTVTAGSFAELLGTAASMWLMPGAAASSYRDSFQNNPGHVMSSIVVVVVEALCLCLIARAWRLLRDEAGFELHSEKIPLALAMFPVVQALLIWALSSSVIVARDTHPGLLFIAGLPCGLCLVAEIAVLGTAGSVRRRERIRAEASECERELQLLVERFQGETSVELELMRIRHDARGAIFVASTLAGCGRRGMGGPSHLEEGSQYPERGLLCAGGEALHSEEGLRSSEMSASPSAQEGLRAAARSLRAAADMIRAGGERDARE